MRTPVCQVGMDRGWSGGAAGEGAESPQRGSSALSPLRPGQFHPHAFPGGRGEVEERSGLQGEVGLGGDSLVPWASSRALPVDTESSQAHRILPLPPRTHCTLENVLVLGVRAAPLPILVPPTFWLLSETQDRGCSLPQVELTLLIGTLSEAVSCSPDGSSR